MSAAAEGATLDVSIAICTWNRAALLDRTLESLADLRIRAGLDWEVLVVDNACTDSTADVLCRHAARLPLRPLHEASPGLAHARNSALRAARGELLLWTDDDVRVDPGWVEAHIDAAHVRPEAAAWGGIIAPDFEIDPPDWLVQGWPVVADVYAVRDLGTSAFEIRQQAAFPYGANWAVRTAVQRAYPFDTRFGVCRDSRIAGEEVDVLQRMRDDGHRIWWVPRSRVGHWVSRERMTLDYIGRYWQGIGETSVIQRAEGPSAARLRARAIAREMRYRVARLVCPPRVWLRSYVRAQHLQGRYAATRLAAAARPDQAR